MHQSMIVKDVNTSDKQKDYFHNYNNIFLHNFYIISGGVKRKNYKKIYKNLNSGVVTRLAFVRV